MFLAVDIFVWCCHFLLNWLAPDMSESWRSSEFSTSLNLDNLSCWNLDNLSCCFLFVWTPPQHLNLLTSLSGTVFWSGLHLPFLNPDSVFLVESYLQFPTLFSSWYTLLSPCCFLLSSLLDCLQLSTFHHLSTVLRDLLYLCVCSSVQPLPAAHGGTLRFCLLGASHACVGGRPPNQATLLVGRRPPCRPTVLHGGWPPRRTNVFQMQLLSSTVRIYIVVSNPLFQLLSFMYHCLSIHFLNFLYLSLSLFT